MDKKKVLVVDDDAELARILSINLVMEGFEVSTAFDGMSAIKSAYENRPDLIILDVRMPGVDGLKVSERLRSSIRTHAVPIVLLSALPKEDLEEVALRAGVCHYFTKPFDLRALMDYIRSVLETGRDRSAVSI